MPFFISSVSSLIYSSVRVAARGKWRETTADSHFFLLFQHAGVPLEEEKGYRTRCLSNGTDQVLPIVFVLMFYFPFLFLFIILSADSFGSCSKPA